MQTIFAQDLNSSRFDNLPVLYDNIMIYDNMMITRADFLRVSSTYSSI